MSGFSLHSGGCRQTRLAATPAAVLCHRPRAPAKKVIAAIVCPLSVSTMSPKARVIAALPPPAAASNFRPRHEFGGGRRDAASCRLLAGLLSRDVAFGPVLDPEAPWGLGLLDLEDDQAARAIGASDPAVESGTCA
jgi:hypothetical protein